VGHPSVSTALLAHADWMDEVMTNALLVIAGLIEFIFRFLLVTIIVCSIIGLLAMLAIYDDAIGDEFFSVMLTPYAWQLLPPAHLR
jgi:hypothetical protein